MLVTFDADNQLHQTLFADFKRTLVSQLETKNELLAQYNDYVDNLDIILRDVAVEDLNCEPEIEDMEGYWTVAIADTSPTEFKIICGFEYVNYENDEPEFEFLKCTGSILVEDDETIVLDIDGTSIDYSTEQEYKKFSNKKA